MEKKCKKAKWLSEETLKIALKRREAKSKGERERFSQLNVEFQRTARRGRRPSSVNSAEKQRKTTEGKDERSPPENQKHQRSTSSKDGHNKGQKR